jgi:CHAT domain-containing protein
VLTEHASVPSALISFFCDDDATTAFVMRSDDRIPHVFQCRVGRKAIEDAALKLRRTFNGNAAEFPPYPPIRGDRPEKRKLDFLDQLGSELLGFLPALEGVELLCVAPHGPIHLLPLHAMRTNEGRYLVEHFGFVYCPSISVLAYTLARTDSMKRATSLGNRVYVAGVSAQSDAFPEFFENDGSLFDPSVWTVTADAGPTHATKKQVLRQIGHHDVVHLTCHGYFDDRNALESGLLLSNGFERPPRDLRSISALERGQYLLTARELLEAHIQAGLVTLRACSTGLQAERNRGDEFEGLTRALLYAGNAAVLASLWNVDQQSSKELLARFYHRWQEQGRATEKWRAFTMAQRDLLTSEEPHLRHPYHWAPLVLVGDWR